MKIQPFVHRCVIRSGPLAGNKNAHEVSSSDFLYGGCENCGDVFATTEDIVAHIYAELTGENQ